MRIQTREVDVSLNGFPDEEGTPVSDTQCRELYGSWVEFMS